ncbi:hypothetical protein SEVIR_5G367400v4 [Setaria viridis]|uniref:WRKY domain-containing protein n=2 Tax=Setaria TaxID=4554 RepID=K3XKH8_SETIT|nr:probable WRKY transcription factor 38 [Setaria italica]XP_034596330.1 probable WRKY transcription factor 38 [Setaria viridis]RCV27898.1 hypothetical protein SETIT_5G362000v2 [Setaria italica]TKW17449.1 hypothetical protein SEVIR_5G367400v2 [Setaria viridis]
MTMDTPAAVVLELMTMGQQSAAHLGDLLRTASPAASPHQELAAEILRCCGRVIDALRATASGRKRKAPEYHQEVAPPAAGAYWSPPPPGPPPKRRARGAEAVKEVTSGTTVDGFIWRKYGQKEINGHKHPRLYYRCAHKQQQGCNATRRVQRTRDHPAAYEIAYYGEHTCRGAAAAACHLQGGAPPPAVVDFGSTSWGSADASTGGSPAASMSQSQGGWSPPPSVSPSPSSEVGFEFEAQTNEWHDMATVDQLICATTPCYASDPVMEFLDGSLGWESVLLNDPLDFAGLHHIATTFQ